MIDSGPIDRIPRVPLAETIYSRLIEEIVSDRFAIGDRLPTEFELAQTFAVSRPVVRQALGQLQADGIVSSRRGSGTYIQRKPSKSVVGLTATTNFAEVLQGFDLRITLEGLSARLAAMHRSDAQMQRIRDAAQAVADAFASGHARDASADYTFHREIAIAGGNALLVEVLDGIAERLKSGMRVTWSLTREASEERRRRVLDEHQRIVHALMAGDADAADIAMRYHVHQARSRLLDGQLDK